MKLFIIVLIILLVLRGDNIQALLLSLAFAGTYFIVNRSNMIEGFKKEREEEEEKKEEDMLDYAEFTDTPVGKAYNPKENYINGIYDFTGHLEYDQLEVVPP